MKINYVNLSQQYKVERKKILSTIDKTLATGQYVGGDHVKKFENEIKKRLKVKYCIALNSGTDALTLGLHAMGIRRNDEVITTPNSFIATFLTLAENFSRNLIIPPGRCQAGP